MAERDVAVARKLIPPNAVELRATVSPIAVATDIRALTALFTQCWGKVESVIGSMQRLDEANLIADALGEAVAEAKEVRR